MSEKYFEVDDTIKPEEKFRTDNVIKVYTEDNKLEYPLILLSSGSMEIFRIKTLKSMLEHDSLLQDGFYNVYVFFQDQLMKVGLLSPNKLRVILNSKVFEPFKKQVMLDADTLIEGDLLHALCGFKEMD